MIKLAYCDFIIDRIRKGLVNDQWTMTDGENLVDDIGDIKFDLHPTEGWLQSTGKTMTVWDTNGKAYLVTVQEAEMLDRD